jgi:hypothetical protein
LGFVLAHAVVIAGDGSSADVGIFADVGIPQLSQMIGFRAGA